MKLSTGAVAAALAGGGAVHAQTVTDPAKARPRGFAVESNHTRILFGLSHFGLAKYFPWVGDDLTPTSNAACEQK
jgi:hypothetical protein